MKRYQFNGHLSPTPSGMLPLQMSGDVYLASEVDAFIRESRTELIRLAAKLARGELLPSIDVEHWYRSTPIAERRSIIKAMDDAHEAHKELAMQVKKLADRAGLSET